MDTVVAPAETSTLDDEAVAMSAAFGTDTPVPTADSQPPATVAPDPNQPEQVQAPEPVVAPVPETTPAPQPEPTYAQITQEQFQHLLSNATKVAEISAALQQLDVKAFGKIGEVNRTLQELVKRTPAGLTVEITDADVAELTEDIGPEFSAKMKTILKRVLAKANLTGTATPAAATTPETKPPVLDPVQVEELVSKKFKGELDAILPVITMTAMRPDWKTIVGPDPAIVPGASPTPYRQWLEKAPAAYRHTIEQTNDPIELNAAIEQFLKDTTPPPAPPEVDRRARLESAVPLKGDRQPVPVAGELTEDQAMRAAFSGKHVL